MSTPFVLNEQLSQFQNFLHRPLFEQASEHLPDLGLGFPAQFPEILVYLISNTVFCTNNTGSLTTNNGPSSNLMYFE